jgi:hypothetical protein
LSIETWYKIELRFNAIDVNNAIIEGKIDGTTFATSSTESVNKGGYRLYFGTFDNSTFEDYYDDISLNNSSGSFQNSYSGTGQIVHLRPSGTGDSGSWTRGGTDSGANWSQNSEVTPDNGTKYNSSNTLNNEDLYNIDNTPVSIGSGDTINVIQVGVRFNGAGASSNASFKLEIEASASGTIEQSAEITPLTTSWQTNNSVSPFNYPFTLYNLPGASTTLWTKADLDTAQIGYKLTTTSTNAAQISTVWLLVDSTPVAAPPVSAINYYRTLLGVGY